MSSSTAIFWPVIVQAVLTYAVYILLLRRRYEAVKAGKARVSQFRENKLEPEHSLTARNNLANQYELPVLFFVVCIAIHVTGHATLYPVLLAWAFVASRVVHAVVHLRSNRIRNRMSVFIAGLAINGLLWLYLAVNIALN